MFFRVNDTSIFTLQLVRRGCVLFVDNQKLISCNKQMEFSYHVMIKADSQSLTVLFGAHISIDLLSTDYGNSRCGWLLTGQHNMTSSVLGMVGGICMFIEK